MNKLKLDALPVLLCLLLLSCGNQDEHDAQLSPICQKAYEAKIKILTEFHTDMPLVKLEQAKQQEKIRFHRMTNEQCQNIISSFGNT